jgi:hypothetical protein
MAFGCGSCFRNAPRLWLQPAVFIPELLQQLLTFGLPFQIIQHESSSRAMTVSDADVLLASVPSAKSLMLVS